MVLAELGKKLSGALRNLQSAPIVDEKVLKQVLNEITIALLQSDVNFKFVKKMKDSITTQFKLHQDSGANLRKMILSCVAQELTSMLSVDKPPFKPKKGKPNVVMFVGLQGSGKTTTCAKYAHYWQRKGFRTCMICADTFRAGAFDQLKQNATKIGVPYHGSYEETDPVEIAREGVELFKEERFEIIIVDTSGRHKQEDDLFDEMIEVERTVKPDEIIFVMDSSIGQACFDQAAAFKAAVPVGSVIISKLDGHAKGGGALSAVSATESPIRFIGTGEHFTDLEEFEPESFVNRLLGLGDLKKLFQVVKDIMPEGQQEQLLADISQGRFNFGTLKQQYGSVLNLGPLNQFMSLIPGIGNQLAGQVSDKDGVAKVKKNLTILDSFSQTELEMDKPLEESRLKRIARGAGCTLFDMYMLMEEFKNLKKMIGGLSGLNMGKGNELQNMMRNSKQMQQKMNGSLDPRLLQQFGGAGNMMDMMKQIGQLEKSGGLGGLGDMLKGMGGMGGMQDMMKQMGGGMPGMGGAGGGGRGKRR